MKLLFPPSKNKMLGPDQDNYVKLVATAQSKAGLITSHINDTAVNVVFERFAITPGETP